MFNLTGRTALVTGASGGIGGAVARALHGQGATVALVGRRTDALQALHEELAERSAVFTCDMADRAAADELPGRVEAELAPVDILVNNAGITRDNLAMRMSDEEWDSVLEVNLTAGFRIARTLLRGMLKRRWGRIVSITSVVGHVGNPGQANYVAAKAALTGMTKALAAEVATRGITVNAVAPGLIETAMISDQSDKAREFILAGTPMGRPGQPAEVAAAVTFLAAEEASYVTGETVHVNGGLAML